MKKTLLLLVCVGFFASANAQQDSTATAAKDTAWKRGGTIGITFSQVSLSNWQGGGQDAISGNGILSLYANYKKGKTSWENTLDLAYGLSKLGSDDLIKTDDRIELDSKYGRKASEHWNYSAFLNFRTQFDVGEDPAEGTVISRFLAPAYFSGGIGMDYKPTKNTSIFISPITGKVTIVNDQDLANAGAYGVEGAVLNGAGQIVISGENIRIEAGAYFKFSYKRTIMKNVDFNTKLDLYSNYENPDLIDVNWQTLITMKVNKFLNVTFTTHLIYDDDIEADIDDNGDGIIDRTAPRTQFKQVLGVGIAYKFGL